MRWGLPVRVHGMVIMQLCPTERFLLEVPGTLHLRPWVWGDTGRAVGTCGCTGLEHGE